MNRTAYNMQKPVLSSSSVYYVHPYQRTTTHVPPVEVDLLDLIDAEDNATRREISEFGVLDVSRVLKAKTDRAKMMEAQQYIGLMSNRIAETLNIRVPSRYPDGSTSEDSIGVSDALRRYRYSQPLTAPSPGFSSSRTSPC
jgi:hypothetical protein